MNMQEFSLDISAILLPFKVNFKEVTFCPTIIVACFLKNHKNCPNFWSYRHIFGCKVPANQPSVQPFPLIIGPCPSRDEDALQTAACLEGLLRFSSTHIAPLASPPFGLTVIQGCCSSPSCGCIALISKLKLQSLWSVGEDMHTSVSPYLLILSEFAVSLCYLRKDDYSGEVTGMHLQERERAATARTHSVLPARADSVCVCVSKKGSSHDSLCCWNVALFMGYSLNVLSVDLLAARTK